MTHEKPSSEPQPGDLYFVPAGEGSRHNIFPGVAICTTAGQSMMFSVVVLEPGSLVLDHSHPHEQMGIMISGRAEFTVGGLTRILGPGDVWKIPGGVSHRVRTLDAQAVALDVFHPIREDYL